MISTASLNISWRVFDRGPAAARHVLVEVLPRTQAKAEAAVGQQGDRGCLLGDHGRVVALDRAGDIRHQSDALRRLRSRSEHRPGIWRVAHEPNPGK